LCIPCQQEQGELVKIEQRHRTTGDAVVFAVRFDDGDVGAQPHDQECRRLASR
jgi:hypothetical protein